jgi:hypothetical protein
MNKRFLDIFYLILLNYNILFDVIGLKFGPEIKQNLSYI